MISGLVAKEITFSINCGLSQSRINGRDSRPIGLSYVTGISLIPIRCRDVDGKSSFVLCLPTKGLQLQCWSIGNDVVNGNGTQKKKEQKTKRD